MAIDQPTVRKGSIVRFRNHDNRLMLVLTRPKAIVIGNHEMIVVDIMTSDSSVWQVPMSNLEVVTQENENG